MKISRPLSALCVLLPTLAWSSPVHNIWSNSTHSIVDWYNTNAGMTTSGNATLSWTEGTGYAFVNARGTTTTGDVYEFQLVSTTANTTADEITGLWNVTRNGTPLCTHCAGHVYGLAWASPTEYFKIYINGETYGIAAYATNSTTY